MRATAQRYHTSRAPMPAMARGYHGGSPPSTAPRSADPTARIHRRGWPRPAVDTRPARCAAAHPDARARAVLRAARHALQRVPPHQGARRGRAPRRSRDLRATAPTSRCPNLRIIRSRGCRSCGACRSVRRSSRCCSTSLLTMTTLRQCRGAAGTTPSTRTRRRACSASWLARRLRRPAPLRHALEPAAAARQFPLHAIGPCFAAFEAWSGA